MGVFKKIAKKLDKMLPESVKKGVDKFLPEEVKSNDTLKMALSVVNPMTMGLGVADMLVRAGTAVSGMNTLAGSVLKDEAPAELSDAEAQELASRRLSRMSRYFTSPLGAFGSASTGSQKLFS